MKQKPFDKYLRYIKNIQNPEDDFSFIFLLQKSIIYL